MQESMFKNNAYGMAVTSLDGNSKRNDPESSVEAGESAVSDGTVSKHHSMIVDSLHYTPQTNMQIAKKTGLTQAQVARRMVELERRGLADRGEFVICPILERKCGTWVLGPASL